MTRNPPDIAASVDIQALERDLRASVVRGEVRFDAGSRAPYATDASNDRHVSVKRAERALLPAVRDAGAGDLVIADGYSCREQIAQCDPRAADGPQQLVRIAECLQGVVEMDVRFTLRPDYARKAPHLRADGERRWTCPLPSGRLDLHTSFALGGDDASLDGCITLREGEVHAAVLVAGVGDTPPGQPVVAGALERLETTIQRWQRWCDRCTYRGDRADAVLRSALVLKLLTHAPTGGLVAAGTTSIPESETGSRNWDYRYCWLRDSSLVFHAFTELGYPDESGTFLQWLLHATHRTRPRLQVVYDMNGGHRLDEAERHLIATFARVTCEAWRQPDNGNWEIRSAPRHNTHSKFMCWAALDHALRIHAAQPLPIDVAAIQREREAIHADIEANAWDAALGSYVGYDGDQAPDASLLLMPRIGSIDARDPHMPGTTRRIERELGVDGLLYRFPPGTGYDGVEGGEDLFAICSFWWVDCMARQGRIDEAEALYERLLSLQAARGGDTDRQAA